ncbi:hypothetical protein LJC16_02045 [Bacteroidales bacterium OttesenSCG-928-C19]|nr:hypothetical protein [Bacteroidales bacterium OttesenSCG-928-C19]
MEKKVRTLFIVIILLLAISNLILLLTIHLKPDACSICHTDIDKTREKSYHAKRLETFNFSDEQKKEINLIWKEMKSDGTLVMDSINCLYKQLTKEASSDSLNEDLIDSLETETSKLYKILLHQAALEYPRVIQILTPDQRRIAKCIYFDMFLRVHNVPLDDIETIPE